MDMQGCHGNCTGGVYVCAGRIPWLNKQQIQPEGDFLRVANVMLPW